MSTLKTLKPHLSNMVRSELNIITFISKLQFSDRTQFQRWKVYNFRLKDFSFIPWSIDKLEIRQEITNEMFQK